LAAYTNPIHTRISPLRIAAWAALCVIVLCLGTNLVGISFSNPGFQTVQIYGSVYSFAVIAMCSLILLHGKFKWLTVVPLTLGGLVWAAVEYDDYHQESCGFYRTEALEFPSGRLVVEVKADRWDYGQRVMFQRPLLPGVWIDSGFITLPNGKRSTGEEIYVRRVGPSRANILLSHGNGIHSAEGSIEVPPSNAAAGLTDCHHIWCQSHSMVQVHWLTR
jgi:hypothetical protein